MPAPFPPGNTACQNGSPVSPSRGPVMTTAGAVPDDMRRFLLAWFGKVRHLLLNVKVLDGTRPPKEAVILNHHCTVGMLLGDGWCGKPYGCHLLEVAERELATNLQFGVNPRAGGKKRYDLEWQIPVVPGLPLDFDKCSVEDALRRVEEAAVPPPSIVVNSGYGAHLYWRFAAPLTIAAGQPPAVLREWDEEVGKFRKYIIDPADPENRIYDRRKWPAVPPDGERVRRTLKGLVVATGGDPQAVDLARHLRLPGSLNRKGVREGKAPLPCHLVTCDESRVYTLDDFARWELPEEPKAAPAPTTTYSLPPGGPRATAAPLTGDAHERVMERARRYVARMPVAVDGKKGSPKTANVARVLFQKFDLSFNDALTVLREYNATCQPPWEEHELVRKLEWADRRVTSRGEALRDDRPAPTRRVNPGPPVPACGGDGGSEAKPWWVDLETAFDDLPDTNFANVRIVPEAVSAELLRLRDEADRAVEENDERCRLVMEEGHREGRCPGCGETARTFQNKGNGGAFLTGVLFCGSCRCGCCWARLRVNAIRHLEAVALYDGYNPDGTRKPLTGDSRYVTRVPTWRRNAVREQIRRTARRLGITRPGTAWVRLASGGYACMTHVPAEGFQKLSPAEALGWMAQAAVEAERRKGYVSFGGRWKRPAKKQEAEWELITSTLPPREVARQARICGADVIAFAARGEESKLGRGYYIEFPEGTPRWKLEAFKMALMVDGMTEEEIEAFNPDRPRAEEPEPEDEDPARYAVSVFGP
jgi:hypothetical protein